MCIQPKHNALYLTDALFDYFVFINLQVIPDSFAYFYIVGYLPSFTYTEIPVYMHKRVRISFRRQACEQSGVHLGMTLVVGAFFKLEVPGE